jgi:nucleoside-diphosphate-sugar epimerase/glyoxylase-like metal-dependent hydrolase (beta-lactamase superfamily II)
MNQPLFNGPILVTGATGFLGQHLVRRLIELGQPVRATGRNLRIGLDLQAAGAEFRPVDLRDRPGMMAAMNGIAAVVHSGALSSVWGRREDFHAINVGGTENVIAACRAQGVKRLVYISSPSVMTRPIAQLDLKESEPLPDQHVSVYSETKRLGEERVHQVAADASGLETVILRPKAIYGPGDTAIFPRLLKAASKNRLPIIGDGNAVTNLTHVRDVVAAILLALKSDKAVGNIYVVTGGEDVRIWDVIKDVVARSGFKPPTRTIPIGRAMRAARVLEWIWRVFRLPGEPPLTTYTAGILGLSQTYDIGAARQDLGYEPSVTMKEGIEEAFPTTRSAKPKPSRPAGAAVSPADAPALKVRVRTAGRAWVRPFTFQPGGGWKWMQVPALFAIIEHPKEGLLLWDTGYAPRFFAATRRFPWRIMRYVTPAEITEDDAVVSQLGALGYDPAKVKAVVLSHFDPDHFGGLRDFPDIPIICSWRAWADVRERRGLAAVKARLLPDHLPDDIAGRLKLLPDPDGPPISVFDASLDLFGDGSIRLVEVPGHAPGQLGAFVRRQLDGEVLFLAADACWNLAAIEASSYRGGAHRLLAVDKKAQDETYSKLRQLHAEWPDIRIVPAHCPRAWLETGEPRGTVN